MEAKRSASVLETVHPKQVETLILSSRRSMSAIEPTLIEPESGRIASGATLEAFSNPLRQTLYAA